MGEEKQATAASLGEGLALSAKARQLLRVDLSPRDYVDVLLAQELFLDAIRFLSRAVTPRQAVFWACLCMRQVLPCPQWRFEEQAALRSAAAWVQQPTEKRRQAARAAGDKARLSTPAGCAALAAFWSGGHDPETRLLSARAAGAAVMIAAAIGLPHQLALRYRQALDLGLRIADGQCTWEIAAST